MSVCLYVCLGWFGCMFVFVFGCLLACLYCCVRRSVWFADLFVSLLARLCVRVNGRF